MDSDIKKISRRSDSAPQRPQRGTSCKGNENAAARIFEAVDGASALSNVVGVIRRLRRGRWTLTEVYG